MYILPSYIECFLDERSSYQSKIYPVNIFRDLSWFLKVNWVNIPHGWYGWGVKSLTCIRKLFLYQELIFVQWGDKSLTLLVSGVSYLQKFVKHITKKNDPNKKHSVFWTYVHSFFENRDSFPPVLVQLGFVQNLSPTAQPQQVIGLSDFHHLQRPGSTTQPTLPHPSPPLPAFLSFKVLGDWWRCQPCSWACHLASSPRHSRTKHVAKVSLATLTRGSWIVWALSNRF